MNYNGIIWGQEQQRKNCMHKMRLKCHLARKFPRLAHSWKGMNQDGTDIETLTKFYVDLDHYNDAVEKHVRKRRLAKLARKRNRN